MRPEAPCAEPGHVLGVALGYVCSVGTPCGHRPLLVPGVPGRLRLGPARGALCRTQVTAARRAQGCGRERPGRRGRRSGSACQGWGFSQGHSKPLLVAADQPTWPSRSGLCPGAWSSRVLAGRGEAWTRLDVCASQTAVRAPTHRGPFRSGHRESSWKRCVRQVRCPGALWALSRVCPGSVRGCPGTLSGLRFLVRAAVCPQEVRMEAITGDAPLHPVLSRDTPACDPSCVTPCPWVSSPSPVPGLALGARDVQITGRVSSVVLCS